MAKKQGFVDENDIAVLDSTAHALKFSDFQKMYFENEFPPEFEITPSPDLMNAPTYIHPKGLKKVPSPEKPLTGDDFNLFIRRVSEEIADRLNLKKV
jgi:threonine synthase